ESGYSRDGVNAYDASTASYARLDPVSDVLVDVAPVLERTLQDRLGDTVEQVSDDVAHQTVARVVVHHLAYDGARLSPIVILGVQCRGRANHVAVGVPTRWLPEPTSVRVGSSLRVGRVDRVARILESHRAVLRIRMPLHLPWCVRRQLGVVDADAVPV